MFVDPCGQRSREHDIKFARLPIAIGEICVLGTVLSLLTDMLFARKLALLLNVEHIIRPIFFTLTAFSK